MTNFKAEYQPHLDKVSHVVSTGRAHTNESIIHLREEGNLVSRIGAMALGGLVGLFAARKGRMIKKLTYVSAGVAGAGSVCYPQEAKVVAIDSGNYALKNVKIAYHFIVGSRPAVQNQDGNAFKKMTEIGMRLFQKKPSDVKVEEEVKQVVVEEVKPVVEEPAAGVLEEKEVRPAADADIPTEADVPIEEPIVVAAQEVAPPVKEETIIPTAVQVPSDEPPVATEVEAPPAIEGDLGQGNLEDKELYTTRD